MFKLINHFNDFNFTDHQGTQLDVCSLGGLIALQITPPNGDPSRELLLTQKDLDGLITRLRNVEFDA